MTVTFLQILPECSDFNCLVSSRRYDNGIDQAMVLHNSSFSEGRIASSAYSPTNAPPSSLAPFPNASGDGNASICGTLFSALRSPCSTPDWTGRARYPGRKTIADNNTCTSRHIRY